MSDITVIIPSSPIPSHPSTRIIEETIASVRYHLPTAPIIVMQDGVRKEQEDRIPVYTEYIENLKKLELPNLRISQFEQFTQQAAMTMETLPQIITPLLLFVEHDTPLVDAWIDWPLLQDAVTSGITNMIRLHYDEAIHPDHHHMMRGKLTDNLIKTVQWHQRPHLTSVNWYEGIINKYFTLQSRVWIEDKIYSPVSYSEWEDFKLTIYDPCGTGQNMKRSRDIDGRGEDIKYDKDLIW